MRLVLISDTHTMHDQVRVPDGDVLIHAGDLTMNGHKDEMERAINWVARQPHKYKMVVPGNHDWYFEHNPLKAFLYASGLQVLVLNDSSFEVYGVKFWGSPVQPWFCDWAFNRQRGADIKKHWDLIPNDTDVLITHGPPYGILDQSAPHMHTDHLGCEELLLAVERVKPKIHVFGHIHGGYGESIEKFSGTFFVNASVVNEAYKVTNAPIVVDI